jgi:hypothetical protein
VSCSAGRQFTAAHRLVQELVANPPWQCKRKSVFFLLVAYAKFRKAIVRFVMSVCPSVLMEHIGSHWMDFHEVYFSIFFENCRENSSFIKM